MHEKPLPESRRDQEFLTSLPDDLKQACIDLQQQIRVRVLSGEIVRLEIESAVKNILGLPLDSNGATRVILNAILETQKICGYISPEILFARLTIRKRALQATTMEMEEVFINRGACRADFEWFLQNWADISADARYKGGYIAIKDGEIIDFDQDGNALDMRTRNPDTEEAEGIIVAVTETARQYIESLIKTNGL